MAKEKSKIYSVADVTLLIKHVLENNLPGRLIVSGQISDWRHHQSGHCYFSLKDEAAVLPCVMWKSSFAKVKFEPENGMAVLGKGFIDVYPPHGRYQFIVDKLEPAGIGALQLAFEQMVKRLEKEGLFDEKFKKPLPAYPQRICILTSESGAAVHDIQDSISSRWPCAKLYLYPVSVQGEGAGQTIASAIKDVNRRNKKLKIDVLIVGRGGGSLEDLWAFNEEVLARAIFESRIVVISAVGHEIDVTIADLVADARASTPTKAGVVAVPDIKEVLGQLAYYQENLAAKAKWRLQLCKESLQTALASVVFKNPLLAVRSREQQLDDLSVTLAESIKKTFESIQNLLHRSYERIVSIEPHRLIGKKRVEINNLKNNFDNIIKKVINKHQMRLIAMDNRLKGLNPKSVLKRGYSITTNKKTGVLIKAGDDVKIGDTVITELADENMIESKVVKK